jgi:hypothetical protein
VIAVALPVFLDLHVHAQTRRAERGERIAQLFGDKERRDLDPRATEDPVNESLCSTPTLQPKHRDLVTRKKPEG